MNKIVWYENRKLIIYLACMRTYSCCEWSTCRTLTYLTMLSLGSDLAVLLVKSLVSVIYVQCRVIRHFLWVSHAGIMQFLRMLKGLPFSPIHIKICLFLHVIIYVSQSIIALFYHWLSRGSSAQNFNNNSQFHYLCFDFISAVASYKFTYYVCSFTPIE